MPSTYVLWLRASSCQLGKVQPGRVANEQPGCVAKEQLGHAEEQPGRVAKEQPDRADEQPGCVAKERLGKEPESCCMEPEPCEIICNDVVLIRQ
eukprot:1161307-Pelagomonas_calceolata.AAC.5